MVSFEEESSKSPTVLNTQFNFALGEPEARADFRFVPEDFQVTEQLGFEPSGDGEHLMLYIEKRGENTAWLADKLAQYYAVKNIDVGYSGLKDRHAVTRQWFSVYLPGNRENIDWQSFLENSDVDATLLQQARHHQKLRRGMHTANVFKIRLRNVTDMDNIKKRLGLVVESGVPNYFGEQRFGHDGNNLQLADAWAKGEQTIRNKRKRGLIMSAGRSYLFNCVLSQRVDAANWNHEIPGDVLIDGGPAGPLWGRGRTQQTDAAESIQRAALSSLEHWCEHLEHVGLKQELRPMVLQPRNLTWQDNAADLVVEFALGPGEYATTVLREICLLQVQRQDRL